MLSFTVSGDYKKTIKSLERMQNLNIKQILSAYGEKGVQALRSQTPVDSSKTANSWYYEIKTERGGYTITWFNSNVEGGFPVAIMLHYGHGTGTGGFVQGRNYINPAIQPIFDEISEGVWKAVKSA